MNLHSHQHPPQAIWGVVTAPFVTAVIILSVAAVLAGPVNRHFKVSQIKKELPLKAELATLTAPAVAPYEIAKRLVMESAVVEALGTDRYLNWILEDPSAPPNDPLRIASILITYYSGGYDLVPHVPDVCYLGAGYQPVEPRNLDLTVPSLPEGGKVPVRVLTFRKSAIHEQRETNVLYTFHCNGRFVATRTDVRFLINDLSAVHAYFCKIEVSFPYATRDQSIRGAERLFERLLPALLRDHLPDFQTAEERAKAMPAVVVNVNPGSPPVP